MNRSSIHRPNKPKSGPRRPHTNQRAAKLAEIFPVVAGQRDIGGLKMIAREFIVIEEQIRDDAKSDVEGLRENILAMRERNLGIEGSGITTALQVTPIKDKPGYFKLIAGERRYWATDGTHEELPCYVFASNDQADYVMQGVENILRKQLTPIQEARFVERCLTEFGFSIRGLASMVGQDKGYVENRRKLSKVEPDVERLFLRTSTYSPEDNPGANQTNALMIDAVKDNPTLRKRLLREAMKGAPQRVLKSIIDAHENQTEPHAAAIAPRGTAVAITGVRVPRIAQQASLPIQASQGTTPGVYLGQQAAPAGARVSPQVAGEIQQATDPLRDLIQPAGTNLAEAVKMLKASTKKPPAKAFKAAVEVLDIQLKQLKAMIPK